MRRVPIRRSVFESIATSYELRCYCGEEHRNIFNSTDIQDVAAGEEVILFFPGKRTDEDKKHFSELLCYIRKTDPETVVEIIRTYPEYEQLKEAY